MQTGWPLRIPALDRWRDPTSMRNHYLSLGRLKGAIDLASQSATPTSLDTRTGVTQRGGRGDDRVAAA